MAMRHRFTIVAALTLVVWAGGTGDRTIACGWVRASITLSVVYPVDPVAFAGGQLGIIHPTFARWHLVQAYRALKGLAPAAALPTPDAPPADTRTEWLAARESVLRSGKQPNAWEFHLERAAGDHVWIDNCTADALRTAARTVRDRVATYGETSPFVAEWLRAQDAVFANCAGKGAVVLPEPASSSSDALARADRAYQTAAAYFYATDYERAETLFRAIGTDRSSPWQPSGRYLAARAIIRQAGVKTADASERRKLFERAEAEFRAVTNDPLAAALHASAHGLLKWIDVRLRPSAVLHGVSARLTSSRPPSYDDLREYTFLMDRLVSMGVEYDYSSIPNVQQLIKEDDLTDWITALQGSRSRRAIDRWREAPALHWLVAAMWKVESNDPGATALLDVAAKVDRTSPAYATLSFLRARLLAARGDRAGARAVLTSVSDAPSAGLPVDALNLIRATRFAVADSFDSALKSASRIVLGLDTGAAPEKPPAVLPVFDVDAARVFTERLPLERLVDAATSPALPPRLRLKVAIAAWTRALQLRNERAAVRVAPILKKLAPRLAIDVDAYVNAPDSESRHNAGILMLLRWSGLRNYVPMIELWDDMQRPDPRRAPAHGLFPNWWCSFEEMRAGQVRGPYQEYVHTRLPELIGPVARIGESPSWIATEERSTAAREFEQLAALGTGPNYLADEAVKWARARPKDPNVPEALARAVEATRWGCGDPKTGVFSQRAFAILHKNYPKSEWAKRTKYWYGLR